MPFLIPLIAAILPFIIWPIELLLHYPYIIEEIAKGILVFFVMNPSPLQAAGYPASGTSSYRTIHPRSRAARYSGSIINLPYKSTQIKIVLASAAIFTLSETVLYSFNIALVGDLSTLLTRFILTTILHSLTMLVILISAFKNKWFLPIGVAAAMLIHYFYNLLI